MKFKAMLLGAVVAVGLSFASPAPSAAATWAPALSVGDDGFTFDGDGPWTLGWQFTAASAAQVVALGAFDADGDGFATSHQLGLWDEFNTLLATATVTSSDPLVAGFRYAAIPMISLIAGGTYTVAAADFGVGDGYYLESTISTQGSIVFNQAAFAEGSGLLLPTDVTPVNGYFGANLLLNSAVPEPATWGLLIVGFGLAGSALRRRRFAPESRCVA